MIEIITYYISIKVENRKSKESILYIIAATLQLELRNIARSVLLVQMNGNFKVTIFCEHQTQ